MARWTVSDGNQTVTIEAIERSWKLSILGGEFTTEDAAVVRDLRRKLGLALGTEASEPR